VGRCGAWALRGIARAGRLARGAGVAGVMWAGAVFKVRSRPGRRARAKHFLSIGTRSMVSRYWVISSLYRTLA